MLPRPNDQLAALLAAQTPEAAAAQAGAFVGGMLKHLLAEGQSGPDLAALQQQVAALQAQNTALAQMLAELLAQRGAGAAAPQRALPAASTRKLK